eukprot:507941-Amphidinium_carterae.1
MARSWSPLRLWHCHPSVGLTPEVWVATDMPHPDTIATVARRLGIALRHMLEKDRRERSLCEQHFGHTLHICVDAHECACALGPRNCLFAGRNIR